MFKSSSKKCLIFFFFLIFLIIGYFIYYHTYSFRHKISKQDYSEPFYGTGSLDGWSLQFDMYTNNSGETLVDKSNSLESIDYTFNGSEHKYVTFQVSYSYTGINTFSSNSIEILVPRYSIGNKIYNELVNPSINVAAGDVSSEFEWSCQEVEIDNDLFYLFTNNNDISVESGKTNVNGMFQIAYEIKNTDVIVRYNSETGLEEKNLKKFNAQLINIDDENSIISNYKTISLFVEKTEYILKQKASKITYLDSLPSGDYIWVKFENSVSSDSLKRKAAREVFNSDDIGDYYNVLKFTLDDGCILVDQWLNVVVKDAEGNYVVPSYSKSYDSSWEYYIGYPTSSYSGQIVTSNVNYYSVFSDFAYTQYGVNVYDTSHVMEYIIDNSVSIDLSNYIFENPDNMYQLYEKVFFSDVVSNGSSIKKVNTNSLVSGGADVTFYLDPYIFYNGTTYNARFGFDRQYLRTIDQSETRTLSDNEYFIKDVEICQFYNGNKKLINDKVLKLFVRYAGSDDYVLYSTDTNPNAGIMNTNSSHRINFSTNNIVGWYIEIYDLNESLVKRSSSSSDMIKSNISYYIPDIYDFSSSGIGHIFGLSFLDVYSQSGVLLNEVEESSYNNPYLIDDLDSWDLSNYGSYKQRAYAAAMYIPGKEGYRLLKWFKSLNYDSSKWNGYGEINVFKYNSYGFNSLNVNKIDVYDLLPIGMFLDKNNIVFNSAAGTKYYLDGVLVSDTDYINRIINDNTTVEVKYNWNDTGRTWIHIVSDFSDLNLTVNNSDATIYNAKYNVYIPYESISEYGLSYKSNAYINVEEGGKVSSSLYGGNSSFPHNSGGSASAFTIDNGNLDADTIDINENGISNDYIGYSTASISLVEAYASQSTLTCSARSYFESYEEKQYTSEWSGNVLVELDGMYEYKNKFYNTAESSVSNVILYNNLESYYYDKQTGTYESVGEGFNGIFYGVDTSFLTDKGYIVKVYYSTNEKAGYLKTLGILNSEWALLSNLNEDDYASVKSLAFEILDSSGNPAVIPRNTTLYVTIQMMVSNQSTFKTANNVFWAQWQVVDDGGSVLRDVISEYSSPAKLRLNAADVIFKVVSEDGDGIKDVHLQIINEDGVIVHEFDSSIDGNFIINKLVDKTTYVLHEDSCIDGYILSDDVTFTTNSELENQTIIITNKSTKVGIKFVDETGNIVDDISFKIRDKLGSVVDNLTTDNNVVEIVGRLIATGEYSIEILSVPIGYGIHDNINFVVNDDGLLQIIEVVIPYTKVTIKNIDENSNYLSGSTLNIKDSSGNLIKTIISGTSDIVIVGLLECGKRYFLEEVYPTNGYSYAVSVSFNVLVNGDNVDVIMTNYKTQVELSVLDNNGNFHMGSIIQILDDSAVVDEFVVGDCSEIIMGLTADKAYTIKEINVPDGYSYVDDYSFIVNKDKGIQQLVITNNPTRVDIKIINSSDQIIEGAKLQLKDGNIILDEWISVKDSVHSIIGLLNAGKDYTIHVDSPASGYVSSSDKTFTVNINNEVTNVSIVSEKNKVNILCLDEDDNTIISDVLMQVIDSNGNLIYEFMSKSEDSIIEGILTSNENYSLHIANIVNNYYYIDDVDFKVLDNSESLNINILLPKTKVYIDTQDGDGNSLVGAKVQILDRNDVVIYEFISSNDKEDLTGILNVDEIYKLRVESTPDTYEKDDDQILRLDNNGRLLIYDGVEFLDEINNTLVVVNMRINNPDTRSPYLIFFIGIIFLFISFLVYYFRKKRII